jgi:hypothetical protein
MPHNAQNNKTNEDVSQPHCALVNLFDSLPQRDKAVMPALPITIDKWEMSQTPDSDRVYNFNNVWFINVSENSFQVVHARDDQGRRSIISEGKFIKDSSGNMEAKFIEKNVRIRNN